MKILERSASRRSILAGGVAAALALMMRPLFKTTGAQAQAGITAVAVSRAPTEPGDPLWNEAQAATVALNPQNFVLPRLKEAGAKSVSVRALYDAERIAFLLDWQDSERDVDLGTVLQYRDAVAIQFPEDPSLATPSFMMGQQANAVTIYHWKSDWQFGRLSDVDEAYPNMYGDWYPYSGVPAGEIPESSDYLDSGLKEYLTAAAAGNAIADPQLQEKTGAVQKMRAEGFGTIEPDPSQDAQGSGAWQDGGWRIAISVPRKQAKFSFEEGSMVSLAVAVWDGSRDERNGQKAFSFWNDLRVGATPESVTPTPPEEVPAGIGFLVPLLGSIGGLAVAAAAAIIGLRLWRARRKPPV